MNVIHTDFLVHWTGKDLHSSHTSDLTDRIRKNYVERLVDVLTHGFYMNVGHETIHGSNGNSITAGVARTCFTEIKLTQARGHANNYGRLGIGVHRKFVMQRHGNVVFYVQNSDNSVVVENLVKVHKILEAGRTGLIEFEAILAYFKNMSEQNAADLEYYDELEWRIIHLERLEGRYINVVDRLNNIFRVILKPEDIRLIVFPDDATRAMALSDLRLEPLVTNSPIFVTLDACAHF